MSKKNKKPARKPAGKNVRNMLVDRTNVIPSSGRMQVKTIAGEDISDNVSEILYQYSPMTQAELSQIYTGMFEQYNNELQKRGLVLTEKQVKALDTIDMRGLAGQTKSPNQVPEVNLPSGMAQQVQDFVADENLSFYRMLPCFSKGAFRINTDRYIYFEVQKLDLEHKTYDVLVRDYALIPKTGGYQEPVWQGGIYGLVTIVYENTKDNYEVRAPEDSCILFSKIYQQISPKELGWDKMRKDIWRKIALSNAWSAEKLLKKSNTNNIIQLARLFMYYVMLSNFILDSNKPKIAPGQRAKQEHNKSISNKSKSRQNKTSEANTQLEIPEKLVRNVGMIRIISTRTPRTFSSKSIRNYRVPTWTARGHTRTYKSGKTVYIKPATCHRKALKDVDGKIPQSIINIVNNTEQQEKPEQG